MNIRIPKNLTGLIGVLSVLTFLIAVALAVGGLWLVLVGGSLYYLALSLGLLLCCILLAQRSVLSLWMYALVAAATLVWALWEAGLDWWALAPRLDVLFVLGCLLLTPWARRSLVSEKAEDRSSTRPWGTAALALVMVSYFVVSVASWMYDPHDISGALPPSQGAMIAAGEPIQGVPPEDWHAYGRTAFGQRYSPLDQLTPANAATFKVAWEFHTGDRRGRPGDPVETTDEVTPLKIGNRLFFCTPHQSVIALDATTGQQIWRYDPQLEPRLALQHMTCRGVSYQAPATPAQRTDAVSIPVAVGESALATGAPASAASNKKVAACAGKLFLPTADGRLIALDPDTGLLCSRFGNGKGQIDLWANMPNLRPGSYYSTSPVVVTQRLVIVGGTVLDNVSTHEQSGVIRAYDIDTGALVWNWDSGNPDATTPIAAGDHYTVNSPNSWSISSADEALGMVYIPMGNQPPDQWGGNRSPAVERYSSSVVALDLATGKVRWVFQTVHHDLWDYDVPSQPTLVDLKIGGTMVPALVQPTKQGELFVLDRRTGIPVLPVTEIAAPQGAASGDHSAQTQPKSLLSYEPQKLSGRDMWGATLFDQLACRIAFHRLRYEGRFTPPSTQGSLIYPGNFGVFNWGGIAVDPRRQIAFTTPTYLAFVSRLVPRSDDTSLLVQAGGPPKGSLPALNENFGAPFAAQLSPFLSPLGFPCQAPPWGYVAGADLRTGEIAWKHRNGTVRDLSPFPLPFKMGVPNLGGPLLTAGGVAFLSGSMDNFVRAYDVGTGRQVWESRLPAGGQATPMTYNGSDGRQYLLVVAGGHGSTNTKAGDSVIAYALPPR